MKRVFEYTTFFESESACIVRLLEEWKPSSYELSEKEHERHLQIWLQNYFVDVPIVAQYGIAKGKADLVLQDKHVIELKLGFDAESVAEFDRCVGQLERYRQKWVDKDRGDIYLVVVGKSDSEFRDVLHQAVKRCNQGYAFQHFHLIEKNG